MSDGLLIPLVIFAVSLWGLMKGADWLIDGSSSLAKYLKVSDLVIGLTVVAFGTSLPELVVSVQSSLQGSGSLAYANVIGSNIANTLLILGTASLVIPLVSTPAVKKDVGFFFLVAMTFTGLTFFGKTDAPTPLLFESQVSRMGGIVLLLLFVTFIVRILRNSKNDLTQTSEDEEPESSPLGKSIAILIVGLVFVILGGEFTVRSAISIAKQLGVSESTIGLTIVAFGTSLPELVASLSMAGKKKGGMIIGNIIGSNVMNLSLVLGAALTVAPIQVDYWGTFDMCVHTIVAVVLLGLMLQNKPEGNLGRTTGVTFILLYMTYMIMVGYRQMV
ncbi:MAG: calcium/sodium antiporter [Pseudobacteriovorax sp.]|nr:calcium/sodium antiporter [Pseudobacteriovorax sp.]